MRHLHCYSSFEPFSDRSEFRRFLFDFLQKQQHDLHVLLIAFFILLLISLSVSLSFGLQVPPAEAARWELAQHVHVILTLISGGSLHGIQHSLLIQIYFDEYLESINFCGGARLRLTRDCLMANESGDNLNLETLDLPLV